VESHEAGSSDSDTLNNQVLAEELGWRNDELDSMLPRRFDRVCDKKMSEKVTRSTQIQRHTLARKIEMELHARVHPP